MGSPAFNSASDLVNLRKVVGLTRRALADEAGLAPSTVTYWEKQKGALAGYAPKAMRAALEAHGLHVPGRGEPAVPEPPSVPPAPAPKHCGAKTRFGTPCQCKPLPGKKRCKLHGGMSSGPRTPEGKAIIAMAQKLRHSANRDARQSIYSRAE